MHAARQVGFDKGEAIGKREGQLTNGVRTCFGNVIAADGHRVEIAHIVVDKKLRNVAHDFQAELGAEDASVLTLVFFQNVGLHGTAHIGHDPCANFGRFSVGRFATIVGFEFFQILIDGRVHEHGQNRWRWTIDGHGHAGAGVAQVKAAVQHFHVFQGGDAHARVAHLAVNVWTRVGVVAIQRDGVKRRGQTFGGHAFAEQLKTGVGSKGIAFTCKHARRIFAFAFESKGTGCVGEAAGHVVEHEPLQNFAMVFVSGQ